MKDVRAALVLVERGEAPLGLVYATDAAISEKVRVVGIFPADSHPPIVYPVAAVAGKETPRRGTFMEFLKTPEARGRFLKNTDLTSRSDGYFSRSDSLLKLEALRLSLWVSGWAVAGSLPVGILAAWVLARLKFPGKILVGRPDPSAAGAAAGGDRLSAAGASGPHGESSALCSTSTWVSLWPLTGKGRRWPRPSWPFLCWCGPCGSPWKRGPGAGIGGPHPGGRTGQGFFHRHPAAHRAGHHHRDHSGLCPQPGRIRRHHHLCFQYPGRDPDPAPGPLHPDPGPRRRVGGHAAVHYLGRDLPWPLWWLRNF